ncbi:uncharacterized protein LOC124679242 [Lolium rigidum]|uniref:uncharacterized protein LOC124679242 n=1 Tax=Lolium rigidum TaxID=89674 RepID=UPI001F5E0C23|nr:uncharacterized protein LOC124679242 [Lolium rigidum]
MAILISCVTSKALAPYIPEVSRQRGGKGISVSAQRRQTLVGLTMKSWGINRVQPIRRATQIRAVGPGELPAGGDFSLPDLFSNIPSWVTFVVGASFAAVPFYRQMRAMQDKAEETAEAAIEVVDRVAEAAEKIAEDVSEAFPENQTIKKAASRIKAVADEIEEDADKAEALLRKLDQIEEEVDEVVDSFTKKKSERKNP